MKFNSNELGIIKSALIQREEYFKDLLDNYEGFGTGIEELYKSNLEETSRLLLRMKDIL